MVKELWPRNEVKNMSDRPIKAKRATISICRNVHLEALEMPDGEFRLSLTSAAEAAGFTRQWLSLVTTAKRPETVKALENNGFSFDIKETQVAKNGKGGASIVKTISFKDFEAIIDYGVDRNLPKATALKKALLQINLRQLLKEQHQSKVEDFVERFFPDREKIFPNKTNLKQQKTKGKMVKDGFIYVLEGSNRVKVGFSVNPEARLKALSRWQGELKTVFSCKGSINLEQKIHKQLHKAGEFYGAEWYPKNRLQEIINLITTKINMT